MVRFAKSTIFFDASFGQHAQIPYQKPGFVCIPYQKPGLSVYPTKNLVLSVHDPYKPNVQNIDTSLVKKRN